MSTRDLPIRHVLEGGWATDFGPTVDTLPGQDGSISVKYLVEAENVDYVLPRGVRKMGGASAVHTGTIVDATTSIMGLVDYWRTGTSGTPSRRRVLHAGTVIMADNDDNNYANIGTGFESGAIPHYSCFDDLLIIGSSSTVDAPQSYDQTTLQNLAGTPPRFSVSTYHQNRQWAAGIAATPSRLHYSANLDPEDWVGAGSGSIDIDPGDGDSIQAIVSFKDELWVFKGPNKGSIHRITGTTPSTFARQTFYRGLGAAGAHCVAPFGDDLAFMWSTGTVHTLKATAAFGDYYPAFLTNPIDTWIRENVHKARTRYAHMLNDTVNNRLLIACSQNAVQYNNMMLALDYRFEVPRWALRTSYTAQSLGYFIDGGAKDRRVYAGSNTGLVRRIDMPTRAIDGSTGIAAKVTLPTFTYGHPVFEKNLSYVGLGIVPSGNYTAMVGWTRDGLSQQTADVSLQGGDTIGNTWAPGVSSLGGLRYTNNYADAVGGGPFAGIQYQVTNSTVNQELEVHDVQALVTHTRQVSTESK